MLKVAYTPAASISTIPTHLRYLQKGKKTKVGRKEITEEDKKGGKRQEGRKEGK